MAARRAAHLRRQASVDIPKYPPQSSQTSQAFLQAAQAPPPVSDYESDNQGYTSDFPLQPPPAARTDAELNLSVLRRHNPEVTGILSIAAYAVIYEFSPIPEPTWSKTGIEGTLFICQLAPGMYNEDRYHAIVLNRRALDNFDVDLREAEDGGVEISDPYVIVSCKEGHEQKIYGVFIFSEGSGTSTEQARQANADLMKKLAESAGYSRRAAEAAAASAIEEHTRSHVQEAESTSQQMGRQISLQELFGQNRKEDAGYSARTHNYDGSTGGQLPSQAPGIIRDTNLNTNKADVLGDLFRRAGLAG